MPTVEMQNNIDGMNLDLEVCRYMYSDYVGMLVGGVIATGLEVTLPKGLACEGGEKNAAVGRTSTSFSRSTARSQVIWEVGVVGSR